MLSLNVLDDAQISRLYASGMRRDFPASELKSLAAILSMKHRGVYDALGAYGEDGVLEAYALLYRPEGQRIALLDYLAVEPERRGAGVGSALLAQLQRHYATRVDALLIECERPKAAPDEAQARKRIRFYELAGAQMTDVRIWLFDVEYSILVLPCAQALPERDWAAQMLAIYRQMLPGALYEQNVRLIRG